MATLKESREGIVGARADLQSAFHEVHGRWEQKPATSGGDEAWSPRQVAEHAIGGELLLASAIARAVGKSTVEAIEPSCPTPASAAAALTRYAAQSDEILGELNDSDLAITYQGRTATRSVEQGLQLMANHLREHTEQMRAILA